MFGINELKAAITASDARAMRHHTEVMDELHDLNMQIETLYDVLERAIAEVKPVPAKPATIKGKSK